MKKKYKLYGCIMICIALVLGTWMYMDIYGNPFKKPRLKTKLYAYIEQELPDVQKDFTCGEVGFNAKWKTYFVSCISNTQPELGFSIEEALDKSIYDTYQFNGVEGHNAFAKFNQQITTSVLAKIPTTSVYKNLFIRVNTTLDKLDETSRKTFLQNENVLSLPIFTVVFLEDVSKQYEDVTYVKQRFLSIREVVETTGYTPLDYMLTFFDETGNIGYSVKGVTAQLMQRDDFEDILLELSQDPQKYKETLGLERENMEPK